MFRLAGRWAATVDPIPNTNRFEHLAVFEVKIIVFCFYCIQSIYANKSLFIKSFQRTSRCSVFCDGLNQIYWRVVWLLLTWDLLANKSLCGYGFGWPPSRSRRRRRRVGEGLAGIVKRIHHCWCKFASYWQIYESLSDCGKTTVRGWLQTATSSCSLINQLKSSNTVAIVLTFSDNNATVLSSIQLLHSKTRWRTY